MEEQKKPVNPTYVLQEYQGKVHDLIETTVLQGAYIKQLEAELASYRQKEQEDQKEKISEEVGA